MSLWIKICGNTTQADAQLAADAGADAVGFIFAPSPRRVTMEEVAAITPHLPAGLEKIGVFVGSGFDEIAATVQESGLTGVQLHSGCRDWLAARLRERFGADLRILQVIHHGENAPHELQTASSDPDVDGVLVDSRTATAVGGTGIPFDWQVARAKVFNGRAADPSCSRLAA